MHGLLTTEWWLGRMKKWQWVRTAWVKHISILLFYYCVASGFQTQGEASWSRQANLQMLTFAFGVFFHRSSEYHLQSSEGWCTVWRWKTKLTWSSRAWIYNPGHGAFSFKSILWLLLFFVSDVKTSICVAVGTRHSATVTTRWHEPDAAEGVWKNAET